MLVSLPLAIIGTLTFRQPADALLQAEMKVRSLTGAGAEGAIAPGPTDRTERPSHPGRAFGTQRPVIPETQAPGRPRLVRQPSEVREIVRVAPAAEVAVRALTRPPG